MTATTIPARLRELERAVAGRIELVGCASCADMPPAIRVVDERDLASVPGQVACAACRRTVDVIAVIDPYSVGVGTRQQRPRASAAKRARR